MSDVLAQRLVDCRMSRVCNAAAEEGVGNASMIVSGFWFRKKVLIAGWLGDYNAQLKVVMGKCINDFVMVWLPGTETFSSWFSPQFHENQIDHVHFLPQLLYQWVIALPMFYFSFVKISYCWDPFLSCMDLASSLDCAWPRFQNKKLAKSALNNFWGNVSYYLLLLELQLLSLHSSGQKMFLVAKPFTSPRTLLQCNSLVLLSSTNLSVGPLALKTETSCQAWLIILVVSATVLISELSIHPLYSQQLQQCMALNKCSQNLGEKLPFSPLLQWGWTMPTNCEVSPCLNSQPPGTPDVLSPYAAPWCCCCCSLGRKDSSPWIAVSISAPPPPPAEHVSSSRCAERWTKREWGRERKVSVLAISCLSTLSSWKEL